MVESESKAVSAPSIRATLARRSASFALLSCFVPGLGQLAQRRLGAGLAQLLTVATYLAAVWGMGSPRAAIFAIAWNLWSAIDAYRHERD